LPASSLPVQRADARRNRDQILAVARAVFADADAEVSMAEVARRAGVGMATLYRNFPGRRDLLEALYANEVDAVCEAARTVDGETPGAVLRAWLHRFVAFFTSKHRVAGELLAQSGPSDPVFDDSRARVLTAGRPLLAAAQQAREVRSDLTLEQVLELVVAVARIQGDARYVAPILQAALDGLRPPPDGTRVQARRRTRGVAGQGGP
jgi:AcrR family transcriptional regulator